MTNTFFMKKTLLILAFFALNATLLAQTGPKIEFQAKDNTIDYGTITKQNDNGIRTFYFKNTGDAPLLISNVQSTCGCTIPSYPKTPILPGQTNQIDIKYNMSPGPMRKTITVESNAVNYEEGRVPLKIKGTVIIKP
jgi:hypothetical protein